MTSADGYWIFLFFVSFFASLHSFVMAGIEAVYHPGSKFEKMYNAIAGLAIFFSGCCLVRLLFALKGL